MDVLAFISKYEAVLKERGIPKMVFYKACEVSDAAVSQWRKGKTKPSMATVVRISEWLGVPVGYLIGEVTTNDGMFFSDGSGYGGGSASGAGFGNGSGYGGPRLNGETSYDRTVELCNYFKIDFDSLCSAVGLDSDNCEKWRLGNEPDKNIMSAIARRFLVPVDFLINPENEKKPAEKGELTETQREAVELIMKMSDEQLKVFIATLKAADI